MEVLRRDYEGFIKGLSRDYEGVMKGLQRVYEGIMKAGEANELLGGRLEY